MAPSVIAGLLPILWSSGAGADVMKRIAAPMVGGVVTSVLMELLVYPAIYFLWKGRGLRRIGAGTLSTASWPPPVPSARSRRTDETALRRGGRIVPARP